MPESCPDYLECVMTYGSCYFRQDECAKRVDPKQAIKTQIKQVKH